jgi:AcrR family transcriptional regulator
VTEQTLVKRARLGVSDWIAASMRLLVTEGPAALKISRLTDTLGVTKGSFYWHFADIAALKSALAAQCEAQQRAAADHVRGLRILPATERLGAIVDYVSEPRRWAAEAAVRSWSHTDNSLCSAIAELDRSLHEAIYQAMLDLGFAEEDARTRATMLLYAGIGYLHAAEQSGPPNADTLHRFVALSTAR